MLKRLLVGTGVAAVGLMMAALTMLYVFPGTVVALTQTMAAYAAGLDKRSVTVDGYEVSYYDGGSGDPLVLLHGMADDKNTFVATAGQLTGRHRVILLDQQGHGENVRDATREYSIRSHVIFLDRFLTALDLERVALGGNSMGGHVAAAYALRYPRKVADLILINAPGLDLDDHVVYGGFSERMETRADFHAMLDRVVHTRPSLPGPVVDHLVEQTNRHFTFINGLARDVMAGEDFDLQDRISEIDAPTLILWGEHDEVVPFNVAEAFDERIPDSTLILIEDSSHSPQIDKAIEVAGAISRFLES